MSTENRTTLKGYFEKGDKPTQTQFANLIDSQVNLVESNTGEINLVGNITASGNISSSGTIAGTSFIHPITTAASQDLNTSIDYSVNGSKVEVRAITAAQIDDGTFATFKLLNTSIAANSIVLGSFVGNHGTSTISSSIITAATIAVSTASVFIHNETGANIPADTPFTASFVVL
jgi:hypothetical protein